jgi:D-serine deaminase-like pyridoxal phosphate-dependent protein
MDGLLSPFPPLRGPIARLRSSTKEGSMNVPITAPTLLLNPAVAKRNITRMADKARRSGVTLRPHFKTHQSAVIGEWFRAEGVTAITVSSLRMARYFADHGWQDILVAFPANWREIETINALAAQIKLSLLVESTETAAFLQAHLSAPVDVWLKLDTGYGRTGIAWDDAATLRAVAQASRAPLSLRGLVAHAGHSYHAASPAAIRVIYDETVVRLKAARAALAEAGFTDLRLAPGDTPTCSLVDDFSAVDEIRPGNFVFYDMMQVGLGVCQLEDVAVAVACPVVAKHPARQTLVVYGGAVHLSKERLDNPDGSAHYGAVALPTPDGWQVVPDSYAASLSQEHGVIHASPALLNQVNVGDVLIVLPVHSCLTANLLGEYVTLDGTVIPMMGQ